MAFSVPFGQYVSGTSFIHHMDARIKLLVIVLFVFALFASGGWMGLLVCAAVLVGSYLVSGVPMRLALRGLKPLIFILVFTLLANALTFNAGDQSALAEGTGSFEAIPLIGTFGIKPEGALQGLYFAVRIILLVSMTSLVTFTTTVVALTDAMTSILSPLGVFKAPVDDIAMMFSIALRFIPLTAEEAEKVMVAQKARGVKFDQGGLIKRARAWVPVLIPLFVNLFRRADDLACAMESRCYDGQGRTHLNVAVITTGDVVVGVTASIVLIAVGILL